MGALAMEPQTTPASRAGKAVEIRCEIVPKINFACYHSKLKILRSLEIVNNSPDILTDITVKLASDTPYIKPRTWHVEQIDPKGRQRIADTKIELNGGKLSELDEKRTGRITIEVATKAGALASASVAVEILAYNEWGGCEYIPELLAAFCMPNDPAVDRILHKTSEVLHKAGKSPALEGYKTDQRGGGKRVWEVAAAIYVAIGQLGLTYSLPPNSFERNGQRIRLPSRLLDGKVATCLDTVILFASVLLQAGLNPVVVLVKGHAAVGVWLHPKDPAGAVTDDSEPLRKERDAKKLLLIETTLVTGKPVAPFSQALQKGGEVVNLEREAEFEAAIDIRKANDHGFVPLGLNRAAPAAAAAADAPAAELALEDAPDLPDFEEEREEEKPQTPQGRLERWQRKLLDLSARNPLLNHTSAKTSIALVCPSPAQLEDKLAAGKKIAIVTSPAFSADGGRAGRLHQRQDEGREILARAAAEALENQQVLVNLPKAELEKRAVEIYRKANTALQEGGSNTLYLALGFLLWKRGESESRRFRAPLILLPVSLERQSVRKGVRMLAHDDEPRFNTTLLEMLKKDFDIEIGGLDADLPADESGIDVTGIWRQIRKEVQNAAGFEVVEDVVLGHFSFAKYLMWKDLVDRSDQLRANRVVRHLIDTPGESFAAGGEIDFVEKNSIDELYEPADLLVPLPADSSQMAAIATAERGKDFIVIGPPGTGKSQTISNMIAHMLGKGKTVLFVSEKTAALEAVYRRLKDIGIGRFCLELHSNKARKLDVLKQLGEAWKSADSIDTGNWQQEGEEIARLRDQLNRVVKSLHQKHGNGLTLHRAIGIGLRDEKLTSGIRLSFGSAGEHDRQQLRRLQEAAEKLGAAAEPVADMFAGALQLIAAADWAPAWQDGVVEAAGKLAAAAEQAQRSGQDFAAAAAISLPDPAAARIEALARLAAALAPAARQAAAPCLGATGSEYLETLQEAAGRLQEYSEAAGRLSCPYDPFAWRQLDGEQIEKAWQRAQGSWWLPRLLKARALKRHMQENGAQGTAGSGPGCRDPENPAPPRERRSNT